tara:strand:+ start:397 stop:648 length:252 start_codon:yes stop_codon:yes gene_type:complete
MHYIWNRAERVSKELMPDRVIECFAEWESAEIEKLDALLPFGETEQLPPSVGKKIKSERYRIKARLKRERANLATAVNKFNNK